MMALLLILMVVSQTLTGVLGTDGDPPGVVWVAPQEAVVVGTLTAKDFVVVTGAPNLTMISGQMMTSRVVREDPLVVAHRPPVAAHMVAVVAHHPSVTDHRPLVTAHHLTVVVVVAHPLAAGTEASVVLASRAGNQGTEHQTAQTSRQCGGNTSLASAAWGCSVLA